MQALAAQTEETSVIITGDFSELKRIETASVDTIIDPLTILLKNGKIIRLVGIDIPDYAQQEPGTYLQNVHIHLKELLPQGSQIILYQTRNPKVGRVNRMGHQMGHIEIKETGMWVQGELIHNGLARVITTESNFEMHEQMYALEEKARIERKGLWEKDHPTLNPDTVESHIGSFQIVEGTILKAATVRNNVYLNFGSDWREDFTIMIKPKVRKALSKSKINILDLQGKTIRVRGWVESYNGPMIELLHSSQLEILQETPILPTVE